MLWWANLQVPIPPPSLLLQTENWLVRCSLSISLSLPPVTCIDTYCTLSQVLQLTYLRHHPRLLHRRYMLIPYTCNPFNSLKLHLVCCWNIL